MTLRRRRRRGVWLAWAAATTLVVLIVANVVFGAWAEITVKSAFYRGLGLEPVYDTRWPLRLWLMAIGVALVPIVLAPLIWATFRLRRSLPLDRRWELVALWAVIVVLVGLIFANALGGLRDEWLAYRHAVDFGMQDPIFDRDVRFFVFDLPFLRSAAGVVIGLGAVGLALSALLYGVVRAVPARMSPVMEVPDDPEALLALRPRPSTTIPVALLYGYGALTMVGMALSSWYERYDVVLAGDDLLAGAGKAVITVALPVAGIAAAVALACAVALAVLAVPAVRRRMPSLETALLAVAGAWAVVTLVMAIRSTPWWLVLLLPAAFLAWAVRARPLLHPALERRAPHWTFAIAAVVAVVFLQAAAPAGALIYDSVLLRGSRLQVERQYIEYTIKATRHASGIDQAQQVDADFRRNGVTPEAIEAAPASLGSLRFLDAPPALAACTRIQSFNQFYRCDDVDLDRYQLDGQPRTVFAIGREIDYGRVPDFQRRHFTFTHGYGLVMAPVNEIDPAGRPRWLAGGIPQTGLDPAVPQPEIYFGAQADMPWAMVNTAQPQFDQVGTRRIEWDGGTGIPVGGNRLAITKFLGGWPYIGGGRRLWNATSGDPAGPDSDLLLYRGSTERAEELAPFLTWDEDPYFVAAGGRLYVLQNGYAATADYPYATHFGGLGYVRNGALMVMDAYSGETTLYAYDEDEPIMATWRSVYPDLFQPLSELPPEIATHLRYGEDLFDFQASALERFHVSDVDTFYNGDEAWAPTEEAYGPGVQGTRITSPARYTYAVLPGSTAERFIVMRSFKPATRGRGIGFSGWLAVDSEPDRFGEMTVLRFPATAPEPLDSLDTFTSNVARDPDLSAQIGVRRDQVLRGNTIVVPVGEGLLYVQPLYLDSPGDSLPTLWQVIVSFGDGQVYAAASFAEALGQALGAQVEPPGTGGGGAGGGDRTIEQLVGEAAREFDLYQQALADGQDEQAFQHYRRFRAALDQAAELAQGGGATE